MKQLNKNVKFAVRFFVQWNTAYPLFGKQMAHSKYHEKTAGNKFPIFRALEYVFIGPNEIIEIKRIKILRLTFLH